MIELKLKKLNENAVIPATAHEGDACMDLTVVSVEYDAERDEYVYGTGLACETDTPVAMFIHPRSSIHKTDYFLTNSVGVVDCMTYRGEIKVIFKHRDSLESRLGIRALEIYGDLPWYKRPVRNCLTIIRDQLKEEFMKDPLKYAPYKVGDRVAQLWLHPIPPVKVTEVDSLSETERGTGGFGSTGTSKLIYD